MIKNRIIKKKYVRGDSNLWGDSINEIHFREDGSAWASNGEFATKIFYNPFDGNKLSIDETDDYIVLPSYLISKKIEHAKLDGKHFSVKINTGESFEFALENRTYEPIQVDFHPLSDMEEMYNTEIIDAYTDANTKTIINSDGSSFNKEISCIIKTSNRDFVLKFLVSGSIKTNFILKPIFSKIQRDFDILE